MSEWIEVISSNPSRPQEVDVESSSFYVYERKNIEAYTETNDEEEVLWKGWKYLERKVSREKWILETTAKNQENVDAIMSGLADLYELQLEGLGV